MTYQSAKVAGMRAPRNNSSSEMPGRQLSQIKSALVRGVSTYTCARAFSAAGDDTLCYDEYVLYNMVCLALPEGLNDTSLSTIVYEAVQGTPYWDS